MSTSVKELLTETLKRAGEVAVPDDLHPPSHVDDQFHESEEDPTDRPRERSARSWWITVAGIAALVLIVIGSAALLRSPPSITLERTQLSAAEGQRVLCEASGCMPGGHSATGLANQSAAANGNSPFGAARTSPSRAPRGPWIVANKGAFERVIDRSAKTYPASAPGSATVYLSAGSGRYYRFTIPNGHAVRVVGHTAHAVTLTGTGGERYVLDLQTSELRAEQ